MPKETFHNLAEKKKKRIINAAINEFADHNYNEVKLSRIIKESQIPRGSFYQYFEDKKDLYKHLFDIISQDKLRFMGDILPNPDNTPFLEFFYVLYKRGIEFATQNTKYIQITKNLMSNSGDLFNELIGDNIDIAKDFYINYIEIDKELGRIRQDVDSSFLAELFINTTSTIAFDELRVSDTLDGDKMLKKVDSIINILKKGIE